MTGERFEGHSLPLELLRDLSGIEALLQEVARALYFEEHEDRQRLPRGFFRHISLHLTGLEAGSAVAQLSLCTIPPEAGQGALFEPPVLEYLDRGRQALMDAVDQASKGAIDSNVLPKAALLAFDRFGRSLRSGETIDIGAPGRLSTVRLDQQTRRRLVLAAPGSEGYSEEAEVRGRVCEVDAARGSFQLQLPGGGKIDGDLPATSMAPDARQCILKAMAEFDEGPKVLLRGTAHYSPSGAIQRVDEIHTAEPLDPLDIPARLAELRTLRAGWLDGRGLAIDPGGLDWFEQIFEDRYPDALSLPYVYPTAEGGIQLEWSPSGREVSLEIDLEARRAEWHDLNLDGGASEEKLDLQDASAWSWMAEQLGAMEWGAA